jgi:hypothetical protein
LVRGSRLKSRLITPTARSTIEIEEGAANGLAP